jgi:hypothetical protein
MTDPNEGAPPKDPTERLVELATELGQELDRIGDRSGKQFVSLARTAQVNRRLIWGVILGGCLDVILTVVLIFVGTGVASNTSRIDALTHRLDADNTVQRRRALCPLYGVFKDSKSARGRAAAPDPAKYDHAFEVIDEGYKVLGCDKFLKESGKNAW